MGAWLREERVKPELVLCSSATRARQTFARLAPLGAREVHIERELYGADAPTLLARLRDLPEGVASVMVIAHNPGLHDLALLLAGAPEEKFPTGALVTLTFDREWRSLEKDTAELAAFVKPRELVDEA
jgi:phosphohistidine phosphatase